MIAKITALAILTITPSLSLDFKMPTLSIQDIPFNGCYSVQKYFEWKAPQIADTMTWIAQKESQCNSTAKNPVSTAKGVFQILDNTWDYTSCKGSVYNPIDNMECAIKIYNLQGFQAWVVYE